MEVQMDTRTPDRSVLIPFIFSILLAGNNAIAVKFSNAELPPFFGAAIRFILASLILFGIMLILRLPIPRGRSLQGAMIYGILSTGLNYALMYRALEYIPAGLSMVLLALTPLLTFIFAWAHKQEKFRWTAPIGALLALGGIAIIARDQINSNVPLLAILAMVFAAACFAESTVLIKTFPGTHPITTNAISLLTGSLLLFAFSFIWREKPTIPTLPATWLALLYLIIFGTVIVFVLILYVVKHWTASASSYSFVLMPIVTVLVASWLANESITSPFLVGGAFVLSGAYIGGIANPEQWKCYLTGLVARVRPATTECQ
jgi:drug/metabolite transporter (DMT)-like permease